LSSRDADADAVQVAVAGANWIRVRERENAAAAACSHQKVLSRASGHRGVGQLRLIQNGPAIDGETGPGSGFTTFIFWPCNMRRFAGFFADAACERDFIDSSGKSDLSSPELVTKSQREANSALRPFPAKLSKGPCPLPSSTSTRDSQLPPLAFKTVFHFLDDPRLPEHPTSPKTLRNSARQHGTAAPV